jgi:hypothetical protein
MGLSAVSETLSLFVELAAILLLSAAVGVGVAALVAGSVVRHLDLLPSNPPSSVLVLPWDVAGYLAAGLLLVALTAAAITCLLSRRTDVSEDLRVA